MTIRIRGKNFDYKDMRKANVLYEGEGDPNNENLLAVLAGVALDVLLLAGLAFVGYEAYPLIREVFRHVFGNFMTNMHVTY